MRKLRTIGRGVCAALAVAGLLSPSFAAVYRSTPTAKSARCSCCTMGRCGCCGTTSDERPSRERDDTRNNAKKTCSALCCATIVIVDRGSEPVGQHVQQRWQIAASVEMPESLSSEGIFHPPRA